MRTANIPANSQAYDLYQEIQAYGVHVLAKEPSKEEIIAKLEEKKIRGIVTLAPPSDCMIFVIHRLRVNGEYIRESFKYNPDLKLWHFRNAVVCESVDVKDILSYIFSPQHEIALPPQHEKGLEG